VALENAGKGGADAVENEEPESGDDEARHDAARIHGGVEEEDVDKDGPGQTEGNGDTAVGQEKESGYELDETNGKHVVGTHERAKELTGKAGRHRSLRDEVEEAVEAEDKEHESQQPTRDEGGDFHGSIIACRANFAKAFGGAG